MTSRPAAAKHSCLRPAASSLRSSTYRRVCLRCSLLGRRPRRRTASPRDGRRPWAALCRLATLSLAIALALPAAARPPAPSPLRVELAEKGGRVLAALDVGAAFPPSLERELGNGLTNVVAVYVSIAPAGGGDPTLVYGRVVEILFDVWEEAYVVTVKDPRAPQGIRLVQPSFRALRTFLADAKELDVGPASLLPEGPFVVDARVEVNPISKEQLHRTREFIANPSAGSRPGGGSRSVLGAMASFLLREPDPGSSAHVFRSSALRRGDVVAR